MYAFLRWVLKILWLNICPFLSVKNMVVVLCLGGSLKKKYEQTFEKNSLCLLEKHLNFLSTQISSFYQNFKKKCFKKCPVLGQRESLRDVPFLETLISSKKCKKKVFNICLTLDFFAIFQSTIKSRICWL